MVRPVRAGADCASLEQKHPHRTLALDLDLATVLANEVGRQQRSRGLADLDLAGQPL
jgi:hypothetical protein